MNGRKVCVRKYIIHQQCADLVAGHQLITVPCFHSNANTVAVRVSPQDDVSTTFLSLFNAQQQRTPVLRVW